MQDATREALSKNGLAITQCGIPREGGTWVLQTTLIHESGESIVSMLPLLAFPKGPQAAGSEITYMRRYAYAAILSITADEDDDANAAQGSKENGKPIQDLINRPTVRPSEVGQFAGITGTVDGSDDDEFVGPISDIAPSDDQKCIFAKLGDIPLWTRDRELMVSLVKSQGQTVRAHLRKKTPESKSYQLISFVPA